MARLPVEGGCKDCRTRVDCFRPIGRMSAAQGAMHVASQAFTDAAKDACKSQLPMLDVLVARDILTHLPEPNWPSAVDPRAMINKACHSMGKASSDFDHLP